MKQTTHSSVHRPLIVSICLAVGALSLTELFGYVIAELTQLVSLTPLETIVLRTIAADSVFGVIAIGYISYRSWNYDLTVDSYKTVIKGVVVGYVTSFTLVRLLTGLAREYNVEMADSKVSEIAQQDPTVALALVILAFVAIAPAEELLFRRVIYGRLREELGVISGTLLSGAIFGGAHILVQTGSLVGLLFNLSVLSVLGMVFALVYEKTGTMLAPILLHGAYNATLFLLIYGTAAS